MDIKFTNHYTRNKELAKEIYFYYYFKRKLLIVAYVLFLISFLANIVEAILYQTYSIWVLIFVPLFLAAQFYCYIRQVNAMVKRDAEVHGKEIEVETVVTDTFIQNTASTGSVNKVEYDKIRNAVQTKNLILLRTKANLIYIFRKDAFEIGTKEEFVSFLLSKGISVKGK